MKKILFITHTISSGGGAERVLNILIDELSSKYKIDVLEWLEDSACPFKKRKNVKYLGSISYSDRKASQMGRSVMLNKVKHVFWAVYNAYLPKLLHRQFIKNVYDYEISFNYLYTSALVGHSPNMASKKIMWMHGAIDDLNGPVGFFNLKIRMYKWLQHSAFRRANAIVAISKKTHKSISDFDPQIENKIRDIYNGYNFQDIIAKAQCEEIPSSSMFRLITLGRLSSAKNVILQLEAIELLLNKGIGVELLVLGEGEQEQQIREYAQKNSNVKVLGFKLNPYPYLASANALIITSYSEGFPTIAVEAMALGKPVISTPVAGTDELINERTGVIVDWTAESVSYGIERIMNMTLSPDIIKKQVSQYTKETWSQNVMKLLKQLDNE